MVGLNTNLTMLHFPFCIFVVIIAHKINNLQFIVALHILNFILVVFRQIEYMLQKL